MRFYSNVSTLLLVFAMGTMSPVATAAEEMAAPGAAEQGLAAPWRETWVGAEMRAKAWSVYTGTTASPFGTLGEDGWRLRSVAGYGEYSYTRTPRGGIKSDHTARSLFSDLLVGYTMRVGLTTASIYVGGASVARDIAPPELVASGDFSLFGAKGALETWTELGSGLVLKLDVGAAALEGASVEITQIRIDAMAGWRATDSVLVGVEASTVGDRSLDSHALGALIEYAPWTGAAVSLSAGAALDNADLGAYGRVQARMRY